MLRQAIAFIPVLIWVYLLTARGRFWWPGAQRVPRLPPVAPRHVVVVIPARNEAEQIAAAVDSLLRQEFAGRIELIVVDDGSTDGTAAAARAAADAAGAAGRLALITGTAVPAGWTGKLWALSQGVSAARQRHPHYLLFTDADIAHGADSVASLVAEAESYAIDLVSHMVRLSVLTLAERLLIPAFVFFFFKLYPPRWVADPKRHAAAAAGGCILIRPEALARAGGLEAIRSSIIDDCALARSVKRSGGRLSLRLASHTRSLRSYRSSGEIGAMISRTAFAQLHHSYLLLAATLLGLFLAYLLPVLLLLLPDRSAVGLGLLTCLLMSLCYLPTVRFYGVAPLWSLCLPVISLFYMAATVYSALQYARGRGGEWKGRVQDA
ncbi:MAG TPA: glycosyltransferase [Steroidobacteraceae bacterium]|nr:glycosyltransferase [Steroidobacteraceae bacterium]